MTLFNNRSIGPSVYRTLSNNRSIGPSVYRTLFNNRSIGPSVYRTLFNNWSIGPSVYRVIGPSVYRDSPDLSHRGLDSPNYKLNNWSTFRRHDWKCSVKWMLINFCVKGVTCLSRLGPGEVHITLRRVPSDKQVNKPISISYDLVIHHGRL